MYECTGLLCLCETGPSHGPGSPAPPVLKKIEDPIASANEPDSLDASYQVRRESVAFSLHRARVFESELHLDAWQVPSLVPEPAT